MQAQKSRELNMAGIHRKRLDLPMGKQAVHLPAVDRHNYAFVHQRLRLQDPLKLNSHEEVVVFVHHFHRDSKIDFSGPSHPSSQGVDPLISHHMRRDSIIDFSTPFFGDQLPK